MRAVREGDLVRVSCTVPEQPLYTGIVLDAIRDDNQDPGIYKILRNDLRIVEWIDTRASSIYEIEIIQTGDTNGN